MSQFEVGDRVEPVEDWLFNALYLKPGYFGTVTAVNGNYLHVVMDDDPTGLPWDLSVLEVRKVENNEEAQSRSDVEEP